MIYAETLIFEVTERCNLSCAHCLRGCARNMDMQKETVDKILDQVTGIDGLVFTGGEPTLNLPIIEYIFDQIRERHIPLAYFWLATNGVANSFELATILLRNIDMVNETDICGVAISTDEFHAQYTKENVLRFLSFYDNSKEVENWKPEHIIKMGNAEENGIGRREYVPKTEFSIEDVVDDEIIVDRVYVRANGDILADCNVSYDFMDENAICKAEELAEHIESLVGACV